MNRLISFLLACLLCFQTSWAVAHDCGNEMTSSNAAALMSVAQSAEAAFHVQSESDDSKGVMADSCCTCVAQGCHVVPAIVSHAALLVFDVGAKDRLNAGLQVALTHDFSTRIERPQWSAA